MLGLLRSSKAAVFIFRWRNPISELWYNWNNIRFYKTLDYLFRQYKCPCCPKLGSKYILLPALKYSIINIYWCFKRHHIVLVADLNSVGILKGCNHRAAHTEMAKHEIKLIRKTFVRENILVCAGKWSFWKDCGYFFKSHQQFGCPVWMQGMLWASPGKDSIDFCIKPWTDGWGSRYIMPEINAIWLDHFPGNKYAVVTAAISVSSISNSKHNARRLNTVYFINRVIKRALFESRAASISIEIVNPLYCAHHGSSSRLLMNKNA